MLSEAIVPGLAAATFGLAVIILATSTLFTANPRTAAIVERFGKQEEQPC